MSWVKENCVSFFQLFCIKIVKTGRIPQHIAFIMDGNRRYAKKNKLDNSAGHYKGFDKLSETLKWCLDLGVPEVTVYAFSIENFKRSDEEVNALMNLARDKFQRLLDEIDQINEWGVRLHVAGRLSLLPDDLKAMVSKAMLATRHNNKLRLNIAYAYTGRDEISRAASHIVDGVRSGDLHASDVDERLVARSVELSPPALLVRTSGEVRLSDFMLWQVSESVLYFTEVLWPEFSIWSLLRAVLHYQRLPPPCAPRAAACSPAQDSFAELLEQRRWHQLERYVAC